MESDCTSGSVHLDAFTGDVEHVAFLMAPDHHGSACLTGDIAHFADGEVVDLDLLHLATGGTHLEFGAVGDVFSGQGDAADSGQSNGEDAQGGLDFHSWGLRSVQGATIGRRERLCASGVPVVCGRAS
ncbi:MAG: hypothetical protein IPO66_10730 [Rhodanobacteraceae bacterium]|nr:hypothetical protein [Rhodanobacteraceae bacterium]